MDRRGTRDMAPMARHGMFLPVTDAATTSGGRAIVIAPSAIPSLVRHDGRDEVSLGAAGDEPTALPWPMLASRHAKSGREKPPRHHETAKPPRVKSDPVYAQSVLHVVDDRVTAARRVYETAAALSTTAKKPERRRVRTPPSRVALDPLDRMKYQRQRILQQQSELSKAVDTRIDDASRAIPLEFLLARGNRRAFAERVVLLALCRVLRAHYGRVVRAAWYVWTKRTLTLRIVEDQERKLFLLRQTSLAHACAIVQQHIVSQLRTVLHRWSDTTAKIRWHEYTRCARRIQKCWRAWRMQWKLKTLALQFRERVRYDSAVCIQSTVRRYLARCEMARVVWAHLRHVAAGRIQSAYRDYVMLQLAKHQRQILSATTLQRVWRGWMGRQVVQYRRRACRAVVVCLVETTWLKGALAHAINRHSRAVQIQRAYRAHLHRQRIRVGVRRSCRRRHYFPACTIQRAWCSYRSSTIRLVAESIVFRVVMTHMSAARRIQNRFRTYRKAKISSATSTLTQLFRRFSAKRKMIQAYFSPWLEEWQSSYIEDWLNKSADKSDSKWYQSLMVVRGKIARFHEAQSIAMRRLNVHSALRLSLRLKQFKQTFLTGRARQIQLSWRLHRLRVLVARLRGASMLLQRAIPTLYKQRKRRQHRQRVFQRWRRIRYVELHTHFQSWKLQYLVRIQARDLATTTRNVRKALWFHHHKVRQAAVRHWKAHALLQGMKRRKMDIAIRHANASLVRRLYHSWKNDALPALCCENRLREMAMALTVWKTWSLYVVRKQLSQSARDHHRRWLLRMTIAAWKQDRADYFHELEAADTFQCFHARKRAFLRLARHVAKAKQVRASGKRNMQMYGLRRWLKSVDDVKRDRANHLAAISCRNHRLSKVSWSQWIRYSRHQALQRKNLKAMEVYYQRRRVQRVVSTWNQDLVPMWRDYHLISSVAGAYYARRLKERYFRHGVRMFWELTAGARRVEMATRLQGMFRSKRARKRILAMRLKIRYQLETRATMAKDTRNFTSTTLQTALKTHEWVFVLFSLPWAPIQALAKEAFCKTATTWSYLRQQENRMALGLANATETITFPDHTFSLMSWFGLQPDKLPCVVGFWQGIGPAPSSTKPICRMADGDVRQLKRRFKKICGEESTASRSLFYPAISKGDDESIHRFSMSRLVAWIDHLQQASHEATAIDLQSYVRGFLARRRTKRYRIIKFERRKQRIREWCDKLIARLTNTKRQTAAVVVQGWIRHVQARRRFWIAFRQEVRLCKHATLRLQHAASIFLARLRVRRALASLLATAQRYPNAPLCEACPTQCESLARLRCRDCDQAFCAECFSRLHKSGKRLLHLCDSIDFLAFNDPLSSMCHGCEVRQATRLCWTCERDVTEEVVDLCTICFELRHSGEAHVGLLQAARKRRHRRSWWESAAFRQHNWKRRHSIIESSSHLVHNASRLTALRVMEKHAWQSRLSMIRQQQVAAQVEESIREREEKLLAIRVQQEAILRDAFDRYDTDGSGAIDRNEFKRMFKEELCEPLSDDQVDEAMKCMDKSGNGLVEFDELLAWFAEDALAKEECGANEQVEPRSLAVLKDALRAKRQMRRYKDKLKEFVPTVSVRAPKPLALASALSQITDKKQKKRTVPGFASVECIEHTDFARKRKVFYRFVKEICGLDWIFEDESTIPVANAMEIFDTIFLPRWNAGELTYDFYFDEESFEFEGEVWQRQWNAESKKYVFTTTRRKVRKVETPPDSAGKSKRRKRSSLKSGRVVATIQETDVEEVVEVVEVVDPRRKQMLLEEAQEAFKKADIDGSGYIDEHEFHRMLTVELCEPVSKAKVRQIMKQLDADGSGKIDFHEFFQWYAVDKCQDYPVTAQMARARALLQTRRRAKATAVAALQVSFTGGLKLKQALAQQRKEQRLAKDCKGAPPELIELLQEGFPKLLAEKALALQNQDVVFARKWLRDKQEQEQLELEQVARERADRKARAKKDAREKKQKRRQRMAALRRQFKLVLIGPSKKEAHAARMQQALTNLDREIQLVADQLAQ